MQDFDELFEQVTGAAVDFLCALGVLCGEKLADSRDFKTCASG
jgi:hypothetical protein